MVDMVNVVLMTDANTDALLGKSLKRSHFQDNIFEPEKKRIRRDAVASVIQEYSMTDPDTIRMLCIVERMLAADHSQFSVKHHEDGIEYTLTK
jgi:hypothetical protein